VGMLEKIGTALITQTIGVLLLPRHNWWQV